MALKRLALAFVALFIASPILGQGTSDLTRTVQLLRQNNCALDLERFSLEDAATATGLSTQAVERSVLWLQRHGQVTLQQDGRLVLAQGVCGGAEPRPSYDEELVERLANSDRALRRFVEGLFAANGCRLTLAQYERAIDRVIPPSAASGFAGADPAGADAAIARGLLSALPAFLLQEAVLVQDPDNRELVHSNGRGCR